MKINSFLLSKIFLSIEIHVLNFLLIYIPHQKYDTSHPVILQNYIIVN